MPVSKKKTWLSILIVLILSLMLLFVIKGEKKEDVDRHDMHAGKDVHDRDMVSDSSQRGERKIKYWVAPMDPTYIRDKPGKSPMGMDLVPFYEDDSAEQDGKVIRIDPVTVQNMGVRTSKVKRAPLQTSLRTIGHVTYDEGLVEHIHTKISGWVEKLFVRTTGEEIQKGQEILSIYSPELVATEEEYLQALSYRVKVADSPLEDVVRGAETLLESTRKRLLLMDITEDQIRSLKEKGEVQRAIILRSPTAGIVIKKHVFEGMKVHPGMELYTIADLSRVWVIASVYEYELPFLDVGQETVMSLPYDPGTKYHGRVTFIYPFLSPKTRTVQVRMEFENRHLQLKPDMYADVVISTKISENVLLVPSEAVLRTGYRDIVITYLAPE
jgi:multidrug efflux pump subunit AcrA (membrane-fusion protein)